MELKEIMRLILQGLTNTPVDAPERDEAMRAYGALTSHLDYTPPELLIVPRPDGYTDIRFAVEAVDYPSRTYMGWVNLTEDIKDKISEEDPDYYETTHQLGIVATLEEGNPEEAKRWLMQKAGELGIT